MHVCVPTPYMCAHTCILANAYMKVTNHCFKKVYDSVLGAVFTAIFGYM